MLLLLQIARIFCVDENISAAVKQWSPHFDAGFCGLPRKLLGSYDPGPAAPAGGWPGASGPTPSAGAAARAAAQLCASLRFAQRNLKVCSLLAPMG